jgi:hypothetical protein
MDNQHRKISGYRELSEEEIALMNEAKDLAQRCGDLMDKIGENRLTDKRSVALATTNLQQGFMWAIRSIAKPTTFG